MDAETNTELWVSIVIDLKGLFSRTAFLDSELNRRAIVNVTVEEAAALKPPIAACSDFSNSCVAFVTRRAA